MTASIGSDPTWQYDGVVGSAGNFYTWCCGNTQSGHFGYRQGKFRQVIPPFGTVSTNLP